MSDSGRIFRFARPIASGGFGTVYLAKEERPDGFSRVVAVKLLNARWSDSEELSGRIRDEARLLGLLKHRNIVDVYDLTSLDGRSAVVMEYLEAVDLRYLVQHLKDKGAMIPVRVGLEIVSQVAHALDAAYNRPPMKGEKPLRVIHRDIKPSNVMLDAHGLPKVLDFGVAQSDLTTREANTSELQFGSVEYMAPERLFFEPETPASDVYSLAATLFEIITGERLGKAQGRASKHDAHLADRMRFLRGAIDTTREVAAGLEALLLRALHFEHEERPDAATMCQDARQLARRIQSDDLVVWSETVMPGVIEAAQSRAAEAEELSNSVLAEDSVVRQRDLDTAELDSVREVPEPVTARESARAAALRRGALAELEQSADIDISPATGAPKDGGVGAMGDWTDGDGWNDRTVGELTEANPPLTAAIEAPDPPQKDEGQSYDEVVDEEITQRPDQLAEHVPEPSVTEVAHFDTMDGLTPVATKPPVLFLVLGAAIPLLLVLVIGGIAFVQDWGGVRGAIVGDAPSVQQPIDLATHAADDASRNSLAEGAEEGGIVFVSEWPDTVKIRVDCKEDNGNGKAEVRIDRAAASSCNVRAIRADRSRNSTFVEVVTEGRWICFAGGSDGCTQQ